MGDNNCASCDYHNETVCERLAEYEDTNLTPKQFTELDRMYLAKCEEVNRLKAELAEVKKQLLQFEIGDTAYLVDFEAKAINESVVNGIVRRADKNGTEYEYDSDLLEFHSDDVGVIVFQSYGEAQEALERTENNELP